MSNKLGQGPQDKESSGKEEKNDCLEHSTHKHLIEYDRAEYKSHLHTQLGPRHIVKDP